MKKIKTLIQDEAKAKHLSEIRKRINMLSRRLARKKHEAEGLEKELGDLINEFVDKVQKEKGSEVH